LYWRHPRVIYDKLVMAVFQYLLDRDGEVSC
jgi:hypothetical protein